MKGITKVINLKKLTADMGELNEYAVLVCVREIAKMRPELVRDALDALSKGMDIVGERFDSFEYFVGDLIFAGEVFSEAMEILRPAFPPALTTEKKKKVILATVEGDLHDIGKNIVASVLESKGLEVVDLGVNVSPTVIAQRTIEEDAHIVALSAVLTSALDSMARTVDALVAAGIREKVIVVVGGACVNAAVAKRIKADFYGKTPEDTAAVCLAAEG